MNRGPRASEPRGAWEARGADAPRSPQRGPDFRKPFRRGGSALPVTARNVAAEVVARVEKDDAFAAAVLDHELRRATDLSPRDRALATELAYGTLRLRPLLERSIEEATPRGIGALDPRTRALLLVAAYQLHYTRIPAFAAVSEAVEAIRTTRGRAVSGFANGALRAVAVTAEKAPLPRPPVAFREATAPWLRRALERSIGADATEALLTAGPYPPPVHLRVRRVRGRADEETRDAWLAELTAAAQASGVAKIEAGAFSPLAIRARGIGDPHALPGHDDGRFTVQEEGSQLLALLLGAGPRDVVLDACAGRGNKASLLAELIDAESPDGGGRLEVADLHPDKLTRLGRELERLGLPPAKAYAVDWSVGVGEVPPAAFDRVLVDAPCSGTGTIRRRPEIQTRRKAADLPGLQGMQAQILANAALAVRPGGRLVYAVCSVLRDECEAVVQRVLAEHPGRLEPIPFDAPIAAKLFGPDATDGRLLTHLHGTDAYYVASFRRPS
ncbi:MAG: Sun protein [Myxococcales bacterium]|nr:Sun protein [Myxococcales bacterium]